MTDLAKLTNLFILADLTFIPQFEFFTEFIELTDLVRLVDSIYSPIFTQFNWNCFFGIWLVWQNKTANWLHRFDRICPFKWIYQIGQFYQLYRLHPYFYFISCQGRQLNARKHIVAYSYCDQRLGNHTSRTSRIWSQPLSMLSK